MHGQAGAQAALEQLCRAYWRPVQRFVMYRGFSEADASDLTQAFLVRISEQSFWSHADPAKGRFRSFLLGALSHFLADERDRRAAVKRGGQYEHVSLDAVVGVEEPAGGADQRHFDREWACHVMEQALAQLAMEWEERPDMFQVLRDFLPGAKQSRRMEEAAACLGISLGAMKSQVHRLRERFRELIRERVAVTVSAPHEIQDELQHLGQVLMDPNTPV